MIEQICRLPSPSASVYVVNPPFATLIAPLAVPTQRLPWLSSAKDQTLESVNSSLLKVTLILRLALSAFGSNSANPQSAPIQNLPSVDSYNDPTRTHPRPSLVAYWRATTGLFAMGLATSRQSPPNLSPTHNLPCRSSIKPSILSLENP